MFLKNISYLILIKATAETSNLILQNDCVTFYINSMQNLITDVNPYFRQNDLLIVHQKFKNDAIEQV